MTSNQQKISVEILSQGTKVSYAEKENRVRFLGNPTPLRQAEVMGI